MRQYVIFTGRNAVYHGSANYLNTGIGVVQSFKTGDVCILENVGEFTFLTKVGSAINCAFSPGYRPYALKDISEDEVLIYQITKGE